MKARPSSFHLRTAWLLSLAWVALTVAPSASSETPPASGLSPVRVRQSDGRTVVALPGSDVKVPARQDHPYPLGSNFRTENHATAELAVTPSCICLLHENTSVTVAPGTNLSDRVVQLAAGAVHYTSTGERPKVSVRSPAGLCTATNGSFVCSVLPSAKTTVTEIGVTDGEAELAGNVCKVSGMKSGAVLNVTSSKNDHILLMKKETAQVTVPGPYGVNVTRELREKGMMMLGWTETTGKRRAAFIVFTQPDGTDESWEVVAMGEEPAAEAAAKAGEGPALGASLTGAQYLTEESLRELLREILTAGPYEGQ